MNSAARCEKGIVRQINQDSIFVHNTRYGCLQNLYIVADGIGGHKAGEVASRTAIELFCKFIHENREKEITSNEILDILVEGVHISNKDVIKMAESNIDLEGMGTTFLCATILHGKLFLVNIGDSRLYLLSGGILKRVTNDHSYVMELVKSGEITKEEAETHPNKNIITKSIGSDKSAEADAFCLDLQEKDIIMLCSDGLTDMICDKELEEILNMDISLDEKAGKLSKTANQNGGVDNISVILVEK